MSRETDPAFAQRGTEARGAANLSRTSRRRILFLLASLPASAPLKAMARSPLIDDFASRPEDRWRFFTDTVMGGISVGRVAFPEDDGVAFLRLSGTVSTANNGGFIQARTALTQSAPADATGIRLVVRGNGQRYFVHLRTRATRLPWQYYQAGFETADKWTEVQLAFGDFRASGPLLPARPHPNVLRTLAIAAFGRNHDARVDVREIGYI